MTTEIDILGRPPVMRRKDDALLEEIEQGDDWKGARLIREVRRVTMQGNDDKTVSARVSARRR